MNVALGFRVKSGYAIAVALRGPACAPAILARRIVELSDPAVPETRQPYHDGFYKQQDDRRELAVTEARHLDRVGVEQIARAARIADRSGAHPHRVHGHL